MKKKKSLGTWEIEFALVTVPGRGPVEPMAAGDSWSAIQLSHGYAGGNGTVAVGLGSSPCTDWDHPIDRW